MTPEQQIARGDHAKRLLEDELFVEAFDTVRATIIDQWSALSIENKAQAEELKRLLWAAQQFKAVFEATVAGAKIMREELLMQSNVEIKRNAAKGRM